MTALRFTIRPKAPFGSPLLGETLFGQLCWAILRLYGKERLEALLDGYCEGRPFAVVADAFPKGCIPLPALPAQFWAQHDDSDRKYLKKKAWMPLAELSEPLSRGVIFPIRMLRLRNGFLRTLLLSESPARGCITPSIAVRLRPVRVFLRPI